MSEKTFFVFLLTTSKEGEIKTKAYTNTTRRRAEKCIERLEKWHKKYTVKLAWSEIMEIAVPYPKINKTDVSHAN